MKTQSQTYKRTERNIVRLSSSIIFTAKNAKIHHFSSDISHHSYFCYRCVLTSKAATTTTTTSRTKLQLLALLETMLHAKTGFLLLILTKHECGA
jgi:hypothetical protein